MALARIGLLTLAGLAVVVGVGLVVDPWAPPGCSLQKGQDCARYGGAGRYLSAVLLVRANAARTPEQSLALANQSITLRPNFAYAFNTRAIAYGNLQQTDKALANFERALQLKPTYVGAMANRAVLFQYYGRREEAARDFRAIYSSPADSHKRAEIVAYARAVDRSTSTPQPN